LAGSGLIGENDTVLDYGCGKGRVDFFLSYQTGANTIGIEYDAHILQCALDNQSRAAAGASAQFVQISAQDYRVPAQVNRCYFFNPFSAEILHKVLARILVSYYEAPRELLLFFYYPADEYIAYLMTVDALEFYDEIACDDLFAGDIRERILIFRLPCFDDAET